MAKTPDLNAAYALETPEDNRALYADWAETYDSDFADAMAYKLPQIVAQILTEHALTGPVLDVGAGTGLVAQALAELGQVEMHALDISPDMLSVAMGKGHYSCAIEADLTQDVPIVDATYGAVVSSGTFTHGHVGPDALDTLLRVAKEGAVFVLSVNAAHYAARGFAAKFARLETVIRGFELREVDIYGVDADPDHRADKAQIAIFHKR